jgi:tetratricopeptide (TPR) repeat protein
MKNVRLIALLALLVPALALAQAQGRVKGVVKNTSGEPIPNAKVVITCPEIGTFRQELTTDKKGTFTTIFVDATKNYLFEVGAAGYQSVEQLNKPLIGGQTLSLDYVLITNEEAAQKAQAEAMEQPGMKQLREGRDLLLAGDKAGARAKIEEAVKHKPELHLGWLQLAVFDLDEGKPAEALGFAKKCLEHEANFAPCLAIAANAAHEAGDMAAYESYMAMYKMANPSDPVVLFNQAADLLNKGDDAAAKPLLEEAIQVDPDFPDGLYHLGMIHLRAGESAKARELLERFLTIAPEHRDAGTAREMLKFI